MTLEVYVNDAVSYRIRNWEPLREGEEISDGRQIGGEWLETFVRADYRYQRGTAWCASYNIRAVIPWTCRLEKAVTEITFIENPHGRSQPANPTFSWFGSRDAIGPNQKRIFDGSGIRWDTMDDEQHYQGMGDESWRLILRLYFKRISRRILRDPDTNNIILREGANLPGTIMHDA